MNTKPGTKPSIPGNLDCSLSIHECCLAARKAKHNSLIILSASAFPPKPSRFRLFPISRKGNPFRELPSLAGRTFSNVYFLLIWRKITAAFTSRSCGNNE
ncbi:hypothetical protein CEXT_563761 [Caerostris extrusa]|uniref:Uncharacterized protein n=1 Tax=Caerostris extrusa TaxID=172846 RepID=A0AAV4NXY9_CAEEX|nr:hypothetical protein CEXT_563761 [Caerostris extrusa]